MGEFVGIKCVILTSGNTKIEKGTAHSLVNYRGPSQGSGKCFHSENGKEIPLRDSQKIMRIYALDSYSLVSVARFNS